MAVTFVSSTGLTIGASASTWSLPFASSMTDGAAILVGIGLASSVVTVSTVTDNTTNLYQLAVRLGAGPKPPDNVEIWYSLSISSLSTRISVTLSATSSGGIGAAQFTGLSSANALKETASSASITTSSRHSAANITPSTTGLLFVFARLNATQGAGSPTSNYIEWVDTNVIDRCYGMYQIQTTIADSSGTWTNSTAVFTGTCLAAFGAGPPPAGGAAVRPPWLFSLMGVQ